MTETQRLPEQWVNVTLDELMLEFQYGYTAKALPNILKPKFLRITDLQDYYINWLTVPGCKVSEYDFVKYRLKHGDFVFARTGSIEKALKIVDPPDAIFASYLIRGIPVFDELGNWLEAFIKSQSYFRQVNNVSIGIGRANINAEKLAQINLPLPPLNEQYKIIEKLNQLIIHHQKAKEAAEKISPLIEKFKQLVLNAAFRGDLTADWRKQNSNIESAEKSLKYIEMNDFDETQRDKKYKFKIPEQWIWVSLSDICSYITDGDHQAPPKSEYGIPFIVISNISQGRIDFSNTRYVSEKYYNLIQNYRKPQKNDILYSVVGSYGIPALVDTDRKFCFQRHIALLKPKSCISSKFLFYVLQSQFVYEQATNLATGTNQVTVTLTGLRSIKIPIMSIQEQQQIINKIESLFLKIDTVEQLYKVVTQHIEKLNELIFSKAFLGELVPQDPNDETASILLERIRQEKENFHFEKQQQRKSKMTTQTRKRKTTRRQLTEVLSESQENRLSPERLFEESGFDQDTIELFYNELSSAVALEQIEEIRPVNTQVYLSLKQS